MKAHAKKIPMPLVEVTLELELTEAHLLTHLVCGLEHLTRNHVDEKEVCITYTLQELEVFAKKVRGVLENVGVDPI